MNHLTDYERDGVVLIRSFLSADEVAAVRAELERYIRDDLASKGFKKLGLWGRGVDVVATGREKIQFTRQYGPVPT